MDLNVNKKADFKNTLCWAHTYPWSPTSHLNPCGKSWKVKVLNKWELITSNRWLTEEPACLLVVWGASQGWAVEQQATARDKAERSRAPCHPWPQLRRCGRTQSSSVPHVDASTQEGWSGGTSPHLIPLAISQAWKYQLFCWKRNKISVQSHPVAATVSTHQPSLTRTSAQLSFGSTDSGKLLPSRPSMTCNQICANSETLLVRVPGGLLSPPVSWATGPLR